MDEIARRANVSKRTLYDFFEDKESLLIEILRTINDPLTEQIELLEKQVETALEAILLFNEKIMEKPMPVCDDFWEDIKCYPKALQIMMEFKYSFIKKWVELLKRGEKESVFMPDINYDLISLMAQQHFIKSEQSEFFSRYTQKEVHDTFFFIFLRGISTDAGRATIDKFIVRKRYRWRDNYEVLSY